MVDYPGQALIEGNNQSLTYYFFRIYLLKMIFNTNKVNDGY